MNLGCGSEDRDAIRLRDPRPSEAVPAPVNAFRFCFVF